MTQYDARVDAASLEAVTLNLVLGTQPLPAALDKAFGGLVDGRDPQALLQAMALIGQRERFRRPAPASEVAAAPGFADARALLPEAVRAPLVRLLSGKGAQGDSVPLAVALALQVRRLKLHPFDLPRLDDFVRAHAQRLGTSALAWTERRASEAQRAADTPFVETIDESNWTQGRLAQRAAFIRALRVTAPDRARALVESVMAGEPAAMRQALVSWLVENLSAADAPFLEGLAKDRAQTVRDAAALLLSRLPGSAQAQKRLQDRLSRIKRQTKGLLRRRVTLELDYPATLNERQRESWALDTFGAIRLDDLAQALSLSLDALVEAASEEPVFSRVLAVRASRERRLDLLARLVGGAAPDAWMAILRSHDEGGAPDQGEDVVGPDEAAARAWCEVAIRPGKWTEMPAAHLLTRLHAKLRGALPLALATSLLASRAWRSFLETAKAKEERAVNAELTAATELITAVAMLTPPALRPQLRSGLAPLGQTLTARAVAAMALLEVIEGA
jgi:hypothetical protein